MQPHTAIAEACVECDEPITNPVCPECLEQSVKSWLVGVRPQLIKRLEGAAKDAGYAQGFTRCVRCHKEMSVCPHCFSNSVLEFIRAEKTPELEEEFIIFFDYDLREKPIT